MINAELNKTLYWAEVRDGAIIPSKKKEDAGYDLYPCFEELELLIPAHATRLVPTGIATAFSSDYAMVIQERGSTGSKGIKKSAGVIDSGYRGEIFVAITNTNPKDVIISKKTIETKETMHSILYPYSKAIAQAMMVYMPDMESQITSYEDLKLIESERGCGALGSSGK